MTTDVLSAGRAFLEREGRLIERRLAATVFDGADPQGVVAAVAAYRNPDGGFGHGLEPDKRCPDSLPVDVEAALQILHVAGGAELGIDPIITAACDWLGSVAAPGGAVSLSLPVMEAYPRADHMTEWTYEPGLNPTAGLAGRLHRLGARHRWLDQATDWCWAALEPAAASGFGDDAHALGEVLIFLEHVPDRARAEVVSAHVADWLPGLRWFRADPADPEYGVSPLHFAPAPDSRWRSLFDDATIDGHLDRLERDQGADGGWAITWEPPSTASVLDWRGIETLRALRALRAYGRM